MSKCYIYSVVVVVNICKFEENIKPMFDLPERWSLVLSLPCRAGFNRFVPNQGQLFQVSIGTRDVVILTLCWPHDLLNFNNCLLFYNNNYILNLCLFILKYYYKV